MTRDRHPALAELALDAVPVGEGEGGRTPISSGGGIEPAWSPDGRELFYQTIDGTMQVVKVDAGPVFKVLSRSTTLFQEHFYWYAWARQYDVTPHGKHFLFLQNEKSPIEMNVLVNWTGANKVAAAID